MASRQARAARAVGWLSGLVGILSFVYAVATFFVPTLPLALRETLVAPRYVTLSETCYPSGGFVDRGTFDLGVVTLTQYHRIAPRRAAFDARTPLRRGTDLDGPVARYGEVGDLFSITDVVELPCNGGETSKLLARGVLH